MRKKIEALHKISYFVHEMLSVCAPLEYFQLCFNAFPIPIDTWQMGQYWNFYCSNTIVKHREFFLKMVHCPDEKEHTVIKLLQGIVETWAEFRDT